MLLKPDIVVPTLMFLGVIIMVLTRHQQAMAKLVGAGRQNDNESDIRAVRAEMQELKTLVGGLTLTVDNLKSEIQNKNEIQSRLQVDGKG
jgi:uncharacterized protein YlxW (UPF0749 family)